MANPCEPTQHRFAVIGFSWSQLADGTFKRYMLRECTRCRFRNSHRVIWVDSDTPVCSNCLSQDFTVSAGPDGAVTTCNNCKCTHMLQLDPAVPEASESYDEDEDYDDGDDD